MVVLDPALRLTPIQPSPLGQAEYRKFAVSHPGQFSVAEIGLPSGSRFTAISLYGIWDADDRYLFSEATLHRAISDLTILLQEKARTDAVLAGDLNIFHRWDQATRDAYWAPRYDTVFSRLSAYGLELIGPFGKSPQPGCKCGRGDACRHVRTFAYHRKPTNSPNQLDFVFTTESMQRETASCEVLPEVDDPWKYSDHLAVLTTLHIGPA